MDRKGFQGWLAGVDSLSASQKQEVADVLAGRPAGEASLAAIELAVGEDRICPHCGQPGAVANGHARKMQRYLCKSCGRTFGALTGTKLSGLHFKEVWLEHAQCLADGATLREVVDRCGVALCTAFRWRHRFLEAIETDTAKLKGIVEADETFVLASRKGDRLWRKAKEAAAETPPRVVPVDRDARKRGGKAKKRGLSDEQVPVLVAADRSGATVSAVLPEITAVAVETVLKSVISPDALLVTDGAKIYPLCAKNLGISHEGLNQSAGEHLRGELHINTVNNRHSRIKDFLRARRGIATKYLTSYLRWFHLIKLHADPTSRYCLVSAMGA